MQRRHVQFGDGGADCSTGTGPWTGGLTYDSARGAIVKYSTVPEYVVLPDVDTCSITVRAAAEMHECGMVSHWCGVWLPLQDRRTVWEEKCGLLQGTIMDVRGNKGSCVGFQENNVVGADNENLGDGAESVISLNDDILNSDAAAPVQDVGTISLSTFGNLGNGEEVDVVTYSENFTGPIRPCMPTHPDAVKFKVARRSRATTKGSVRRRWGTT